MIKGFWIANLLGNDGDNLCDIMRIWKEIWSSPTNAKLSSTPSYNPKFQQETAIDCKLRSQITTAVPQVTINSHKLQFCPLITNYNSPYQPDLQCRGLLDRTPRLHLGLLVCQDAFCLVIFWHFVNFMGFTEDFLWDLVGSVGDKSWGFSMDVFSADLMGF